MKDTTEQIIYQGMTFDVIGDCHNAIDPVGKVLFIRPTAGLSERVEPHTLDTVYLTPTPAAITEILNKAYAAFEDANWPEHDCKWESTAPTPLLIPNKKEPTK